MERLYGLVFASGVGTIFHFSLLSVFGLLVSSLWLSPVWAGAGNTLAYGALEREKLDIYAPAQASDWPVMLYVHGGGWKMGDKKRVGSKAKAFNQAGYVFVATNYPLLPDHPVEQQAHSVAKAVTWMASNIAASGGDPAQIHIMGHSAGAHLVGLVATDHRYFHAVGGDPALVKSVISVDGAAFNIPWRMKSLQDAGWFARRLFSQAFGRDPKRWAALSPFHHLEAGKPLPPFLFLTAEQRTASNNAADGFIEKLHRVGGRAFLRAIADRNHATINRKMGEAGDPAFQAILDFVR